MNLLVIRHAIAEDREQFARSGRSDDLRPLTEDGRAKMRRVAAGLRAEVAAPVLVATSPLVRARATAEIVATSLGIVRVETVEALRPDAPYDQLLDWLAARAADDRWKTVAVVGHEPHLGGLVTWLLTGVADSRVEFKKGGACLLAFDGEPGAGDATLSWLLTPSQLRRLDG